MWKETDASQVVIPMKIINEQTFKEACKNLEGKGPTANPNPPGRPRMD